MSRTSNLVGTISGVTLAVALAACSSKVTGSVSSTGGSLGTFSKTPTSCESGQRWSFFGAVFFVDGDSQSVLDLVKDPVSGWFVKVGYPGVDKMAVFGAHDCSVLDVDVHKTNTTINDVRAVEGSAKFDCTSGSDGRVTGQLEFEKCH
jgi:hypothetical protein